MRPTTRPMADVDENAPTIASEGLRSSRVAEEAPKGAFETQMSRYEIGEKLGAGGMAAVFRAKDKINGDMVALKVIENGDDDHSRQARFEREVRAAGGLVHENVCRVLTYGRAPQKLFMAMEIVEGSTLQRVIKARGTMPVSLALEALRQLLLALDCAHSKGVVHRDLKPANVMITPDGTLKLLDFGIAKSQEDETVTATGLLIGTPAFMAPEQILGAGIDARSDLFSAGVTFLVMLTGRTRFSGHDPAAVMVKVTSEPVPSLLEECPAAATAVEKMLSMLCAQNIEARFQSARDALVALLALDDLPSPADGKRLLARYLQDPDEVAVELAGRAAQREQARAARLLKLGTAAHPAAALSLHRAVMLLPDEDTRRELRRICEASNLTFDPVDDPRIIEATVAFDKTPNAAGVLKRLADLYKARGHVLLAAAFLTRYLRVKPQDSVAAQQLSVLIDGPSPAGAGRGPLTIERAGGERSGNGSANDRERTGSGERMQTRDIIAGIKTGGQISPVPPRRAMGPASAQSQVGGQGGHGGARESTDPRRAAPPRAEIATTVQLSTAERAPPMTMQGRAAPGAPHVPQFAGPQGAVATPSVIITGNDDRVRASIHPIYMVIGALVVAGIVIAFFGRFVRTTVDDVQLAINDNAAHVGASEANAIERLRRSYLEEAKGHLERGNHSAAARQINLLLATNPPAEQALEGIWLRAQARLRLNDQMSARIDLEEYLKQSTLSDPHRAEAKKMLDDIYAAKAAAAEPPANLVVPPFPSSAPSSAPAALPQNVPVGAQGIEPVEPKAPGTF